MEKVDDRTMEQRKTHTIGVVARDNFLSGWGHSIGGYSRCAWAVAPDANIDKIYQWVKSRTEMQYVAIVNLSKYRPPRGTARYHVYVCGKEHSSQK